jgi:hypothetical protein
MNILLNFLFVIIPVILSVLFVAFLVYLLVSGIAYWVDVSSSVHDQQQRVDLKPYGKATVFGPETVRPDDSYPLEVEIYPSDQISNTVVATVTIREDSDFLVLSSAQLTTTLTSTSQLVRLATGIETRNPKIPPRQVQLIADLDVNGSQRTGAAATLEMKVDDWTRKTIAAGSFIIGLIGVLGSIFGLYKVISS